MSKVFTDSKIIEKWAKSRIVANLNNVKLQLINIWSESN